MHLVGEIVKNINGKISVRADDILLSIRELTQNLHQFIAIPNRIRAKLPFSTN
jgi:hypothetical protein